MMAYIFITSVCYFLLISDGNLTGRGYSPEKFLISPQFSSQGTSCITTFVQVAYYGEVQILILDYIGDTVNSTNWVYVSSNQEKYITLEAPGSPSNAYRVYIHVQASTSSSSGVVVHSVNVTDGPCPNQGMNDFNLCCFALR